ncbi:MAG: DUF1587 domain-containing protein, partial [Armatimonadetes bacterium]|nr:DUF1587 domain-containing protein [Armatimonadota bacterium]
MGGIGNWIPLAQRRFLSLGAAAALLSVAAFVQPRPQDSALQASFDRDVKPLLTEYCTGCHSGPAATAGLRLDAVTGPEQVRGERSRWELLRNHVSSGFMPPIGAPKPTDSERRKIVAWVDKVLAGSRKPGDPGRVTIRRLNRSEYNNTVRDLLYVDLSPADDFPSDDVGYGFDNIGDALTISPLLMERYMSAAAKISRLAVGDPAARPAGETYQAAQNLRGSRGTVITVQDERVSEDVPFGSRGGIAIRHHFLADGEYHIKIQLQMDGNYYLR